MVISNQEDDNRDKGSASAVKLYNYGEIIKIHVIYIVKEFLELSGVFTFV